MATTALPVVDLHHPEFDPPDCPSWAKESVPPAIQPFRGRNGLPEVYHRNPVPLAMNVRGVDRYHANQFIVYRPETAEYLYHHYTPLNVNYRPGLLPRHEALAHEVTVDCTTQTECVQALLTCGVTHVKHPYMPPCGASVESDRNLDDESLLASGLGWCNEQARVFVRLCQVSNIPARLIQLFYADRKTGHCVAECYADGHWIMADASWFCLFPGPDGHPLSAAACHDGSRGQRCCGLAYHQRLQSLLRRPDAELNLSNFNDPAGWRRDTAAQTSESLAAKHYCFGVMNYPLPTA